MANNLDIEHVWVIDTAAATNIVEDFVRIAGVRWVVRSAGVATDRCEIANGLGEVMWEAVNEAGAAQFQVESGHPLYLKGLRVPTLARGLLYIYLDTNAS